MEITNLQRTEILIQALPYIKKYNNKIVVIKYGGNAMVNDELTNSVMEDIVLLQLVGVKVLLIHGGGSEISEVLDKMNMQSKFINGLRVTTKETIDVVLMVLAGKINKSLVNLIHKNRGKAIGLSGIDGRMIKTIKRDDELGFVGTIEKINPQIIIDTLDKGYVPVISTLAFDDAGNIYNVNADTTAAEIAGSLNAESYIIMTDVKGLYRNINDKSSFISEIHMSELVKLMKSGSISGGMIPKVDSCIAAINSKVKKAVIIDGRIPHSILLEMFTDEGIGTLIGHDPITNKKGAIL